MSKLADVVASIAEQADEAVAEANKAIGGKDECSEAQIVGILDAICTNRDHETDAAIRVEARSLMKSKGYTYKPEKAAK